MAEFVIRDDLLAPEEKKTLEYTGSHPSRLLKEMPEIMKDVLKIAPGDVFEDDIRWDVSEDPISFYGVWRCKDAKDDNSKIWIKITVQGEQSKKDKTGNIKVWITGYLETKFPYNIFLQKSLLWLYNNFFYSNQRRKYIEDGREHIERLEDEIRALFNLIRREG